MARADRQWDDAAASYGTALTLTCALDDASATESTHADLVLLYLEKAMALRVAELWDQSLAALRESLRLAQEFDLPHEAAARQTDMLVTASARLDAMSTAGDWSQAEQAAQGQLTLAQEFSNANAQADALYALGAIAAQTKQWESAKGYYEQARPLLLQEARSDTLSALDVDLATANDILDRRAQLAQSLADAQSAREQAHYDDAAASYRTALILARGLEDDSTGISARNGLVSLFDEQAAGLLRDKIGMRRHALTIEPLILPNEFQMTLRLQRTHRVISFRSMRTKPRPMPSKSRDAELQALREKFATCTGIRPAARRAAARQTRHARHCLCTTGCYVNRR